MGKSKIGPYAVFVHEQKRLIPEWKNKTNQELFRLADPLWTKLSDEERSYYILKAKGTSKTENNNHIQSQPDKVEVLGGYDTFGRPLADIEKRDQELREMEEKRTHLVSKMVEAASKEDNLEFQVFYLMHVNIFVKTPDPEIYVPAEIAIAKFSIENGLIGTYQAFPEPGKIPPGYKYKCMEKSDLHHKIPIDVERKERKLDDTLTEELFYTTDAEIIDNIRKFLNGSDVVFCMPSNADDCKGVLDTIVSRSTLPDLNLNYLHAPDLLHNLVKGFLIPNSFMALEEFDKERFMFNKGIICSWHEAATETNNCSEAFVKSWAFTVLAFTNQVYDIPKVEGKHCPFGSFESDVVEEWDIKEERKIKKEVRGYGHGEFASSDIRYRHESEASTRDDVSTVSEYLAKNTISDFDSEYELPGPSPASAPPSSASSTTGAGMLLQKLKSQRSSRLAANLN